MSEENGYVNIKRATGDVGELLILEKQNFIGIPLKEDEAEYVCRTIALYLGLSIVDQRENIRVLTLKANENSTKEKPLGFEHS
uniref:hypothetical protein n=1 Tax=Aliarcobacter sp. TaxID=2321116 RepID=UPI004048BC91